MRRSQVRVPSPAPNETDYFDRIVSLFFYLKILFLLRLPPILPYDALSYTCGLTKIKYSDFIWASVLGVAPETLCYVILGMNFNNPFSVKFILPLIIIIFGIIFTKKLVKR